MPDIITYKLGLDLDNREALKKIQEVENEITEIDDKSVTVNFKYNDNRVDFQKKVKAVADSNPTLGIQFQYDVNKRALLQAKDKLKDMEDIQVGVNTKGAKQYILDLKHEIKELYKTGASDDIITSKIQKLLNVTSTIDENLLKDTKKGLSEIYKNVQGLSELKPQKLFDLSEMAQVRDDIQYFEDVLKSLKKNGAIDRIDNSDNKALAELVERVELLEDKIADLNAQMKNLNGEQYEKAAASIKLMNDALQNVLLSIKDIDNTKSIDLSSILNITGDLGNPEQYRSLGNEVGRSYAQGIEEEIEHVKETTTNMVNEGFEAAKSALADNLKNNSKIALDGSTEQQSKEIEAIKEEKKALDEELAVLREKEKVIFRLDEIVDQGNVKGIKDQSKKQSKESEIRIQRIQEEIEKINALAKEYKELYDQSYDIDEKDTVALEEMRIKLLAKQKEILTSIHRIQNNENQSTRNKNLATEFISIEDLEFIGKNLKVIFEEFRADSDNFAEPLEERIEEITDRLDVLNKALETTQKNASKNSAEISSLFQGEAPKRQHTVTLRISEKAEEKLRNKINTIIEHLNKEAPPVEIQVAFVTEYKAKTAAATLKEVAEQLQDQIMDMDDAEAQEKIHHLIDNIDKQLSNKLHLEVTVDGAKEVKGVIRNLKNELKKDLKPLDIPAYFSEKTLKNLSKQLNEIDWTPIKITTLKRKKDAKEDNNALMQEYTPLTILKKMVQEVQRAIDKKTEAFKTESEQVKIYSEKEIGYLTPLLEAFTKIKEVLSDIQQLTLTLGDIKFSFDAENLAKMVDAAGVINNVVSSQTNKATTSSTTTSKTSATSKSTSKTKEEVKVTKELNEVKQQETKTEENNSKAKSTNNKAKEKEIETTKKETAQVVASYKTKQGAIKAFDAAYKKVIQNYKEYESLSKSKKGITDKEKKHFNNSNKFFKEKFPSLAGITSSKDNQHDKLLEEFLNSLGNAWDESTEKTKKTKEAVKEVKEEIKEVGETAEQINPEVLKLRDSLKRQAMNDLNTFKGKDDLRRAVENFIGYQNLGGQESIQDFVKDPKKISKVTKEYERQVAVLERRKKSLEEARKAEALDEGFKPVTFDEVKTLNDLSDIVEAIQRVETEYENLKKRIDKAGGLKFVSDEDVIRFYQLDALENQLNKKRNQVLNPTTAKNDLDKYTSQIDKLDEKFNEKGFNVDALKEVYEEALKLNNELWERVNKGEKALETLAKRISKIVDETEQSLDRNGLTRVDGKWENTDDFIEEKSEVVKTQKEEVKLQEEVKTEQKETNKYAEMTQEQLEKCKEQEERWLARCKEGSDAYQKRQKNIEKINSLLSSSIILDNKNNTSSNDNLDNIKKFPEKYTEVSNSINNANQNIVSFNTKTKEAKEEIEHLGLAASRVFSEIGLSYDEYVNKISSQKKGMNWGERLATVINGKIVDSIKGTGTWTGWIDELDVNELTEKILHLHPNGKGASEVFSSEDILKYYENVLMKGLKTPFELIQNKQKSILDFNGIKDKDIGYVVTALSQIQAIVDQNLKSNGGKIANQFTEEYQQLYNSLIKSIMEQFHGSFITEKDISSKLDQRIIKDNTGALHAYTKYLRGGIDQKTHGEDDASSYLYLKNYFKKIRNGEDKAQQALDDFNSFITLLESSFKDIENGNFDINTIEAYKELFTKLVQLNEDTKSLDLSEYFKRNTYLNKFDPDKNSIFQQVPEKLEAIQQDANQAGMSIEEMMQKFSSDDIISMANLLESVRDGIISLKDAAKVFNVTEEDLYTAEKIVSNAFNENNLSSDTNRITEQARAEMQAEEAAYDARVKAEAAAKREMESEEAAYDASVRAKVEAERAGEAIVESQDRVQKELLDTVSILEELNKLVSPTKIASSKNIQGFNDSLNGLFGDNKSFEKTLRSLKEWLKTFNEVKKNGSRTIGNYGAISSVTDAQFMENQNSIAQKLGYNIKWNTDNQGYLHGIVSESKNVIKSLDEVFERIFNINELVAKSNETPVLSSLKEIPENSIEGEKLYQRYSEIENVLRGNKFTFDSLYAEGIVDSISNYLIYGIESFLDEFISKLTQFDLSGYADTSVAKAVPEILSWANREKEYRINNPDLDFSIEKVIESEKELQNAIQETTKEIKNEDQVEQQTTEKSVARFKVKKNAIDKFKKEYESYVALLKQYNELEGQSDKADKRKSIEEKLLAKSKKMPELMAVDLDEENNYNKLLNFFLKSQNANWSSKAGLKNTSKENADQIKQTTENIEKESKTLDENTEKTKKNTKAKKDNNISQKDLYEKSKSEENNIIEESINGMTQGITNAEQKLYDKVEEIALKALEKAKEVLDIHSPSGEFRKVGIACIEGSIQGIEEKAPELYAKIKTIMSKTVEISKDIVTEQPIDPLIDLISAKNTFEPFFNDAEKINTREGQEAALNYYKAYQRALNEKVNKKDLDANLLGKKLFTGNYTNYKKGTGVLDTTTLDTALEETSKSLEKLSSPTDIANLNALTESLTKLGATSEDAEKLANYLKALINVFTVLGNKNADKKIEQISKSMEGLKTAFSGLGIEESGFLSQLDSILSRTDELKSLADIVKNDKSVVKNAQKQAQRKAEKETNLENAQELFSKYSTDIENSFKNLASNNSWKVITSQIEPFEDGLIHIKALIEEIGEDGEKLHKYVTYTTATGEQLTHIETRTDLATITKKVMAYEKLQKIMEKIVPDAKNIGHVTPDNAEWENLVELMESFGIKADEVVKIIRQIDELGHESFEVFDKNGDRTTIGVSSVDILGLKESLLDIDKIQKVLNKDINKFGTNVKRGMNLGELQAEDFIQRLREMQDYMQELQKLANFGNSSAADILNVVSDRYGAAIKDFANYLDLSKFASIKKAPETEQLFENLKESANEVSIIFSKLQNQQPITPEDERLIRSYIQDTNRLNEELKKRSGILANEAEVSKEIKKAWQNARSNTANKELTKEFENLALEMEKVRDAYNGMMPKNQLDEFKAKIQGLTAELEKSGVKGKAWGQMILDSLKSANARFIANYFSFQDIIRYTREFINTVKEVDSAITELRKVSDSSNIRLQESFKQSAETAKELGNSITNVISQTSDWVRLGYGIDEAEKLARVTTLFQTVGDNMTTESASETMISTLKAYNLSVDESERIVDQYNEVANNFAIDTAGLSESITRAGAALSAAGNELSESMGLVVAANDSLQDPSSVGQMLKTMSMRLRGASASDLEELGIDTEGMTQGTKSVVKQFRAMAGINIMEGTEYKTTYQILDELHDKWADLTDAERAALTEAVGGKRGGSVMSSLMTNWEDAQAVVKKAEESTGSAQREQENYAKSIQYSLDRLNASWQELQTDALNSTFVKDVVDFGNRLINIIDEIIKKMDGAIPIITTIGSLLAAQKNIGFFNDLPKNLSGYGQILTSFKNSVINTTKDISTSFDNITTDLANKWNSGTALNIASNIKPLEGLSGYIDEVNKLEKINEVVNELNVNGLNEAVKTSDQFNDKMERGYEIINGYSEVSQESLNEMMGIEKEWDEQVHERLHAYELTNEVLEEQENYYLDIYDAMADAEEIEPVDTSIMESAIQLKEQQAETVQKSSEALQAEALAAENNAVAQANNTAQTEASAVAENANTIATQNSVAAQQQQLTIMAQEAVLKTSTTAATQQETLAILSQIAGEEGLTLARMQAIAVMTEEELIQNALALGLNNLTATQARAVIQTAQLTVKQYELANASRASMLAANLAKMAIGGLIGIIGGMVMNKVISWIDDFIHREEKMAEAAKEAKNEIQNIQKTFEDLKSTTNDIKRRYAELAQGVQNLGTAFQSQGTLSTDEYEEFLDLSNQLAELYPSLTKGYTDNGDALLELSGKTETIVSSLNKLIDRSEQLARMDIADNMEAVWDDDINKIKHLQDDLDGYTRSVLKTNGEPTLDRYVEERIGGYKDQLEAYENLYTYITTHPVDAFSESLFGNFSDNLESNDIFNYLYEVVQQVNSKKATEIMNIYSKKNGGLGVFSLNKILDDNELERVTFELQKQVNNYRDKVAKAEGDIAEINSEFQSNLISYLGTSTTFKGLDEGLQKIAYEMFNEFDITEIDIEEISSFEDLGDWYTNEIINQLAKIDDEEIKQSLANIFKESLTIGDLSKTYQEILDYLTKPISEGGLGLSKTPGGSGYELVFELTTRLENVATDKNELMSHLLGDNWEWLDKETKDKYYAFIDSLLPEDREKLLSLDINAKSLVHAEEKIEYFKGLLDEIPEDIEVTLDIRTAADAVDTLADTEEAINSLADLFWQTVKKDPNASEDDLSAWGFADPAKINAIEKAFNNLAERADEVTQEDLSAALNDFENTLVRFPNDAEKAQQAINQLITAYINESDLLKDLTEENKEYMMTRLESIGITNAQEVVESRLQGAIKETITHINELRESWYYYNQALKANDSEEAKEYFDQVKEYLLEALTPYDNEGNPVTDSLMITDEFVQEHNEQINKMVRGDEEAFRQLQKELMSMQLERLFIDVGVYLSDEDLDNMADQLADVANQVQDIEIGAYIDEDSYLQSLADILKQSGMTVDNIIKAFEGVGIEAEFGPDKEADVILKNGANGMPTDVISKVAVPSFRFKKAGTASTSKTAEYTAKPPENKNSGGGSSKDDKEDDKIKDQLDVLKWLYDNDVIDYKHYLDQKKLLLDRALAEGLIDNKRYFEEIHTWLRETLELYNSVISYATKLLDKEIDRLEKERDERIKSIEEQRDAELKAIDEEIEAQEKKIKLKQTEIDELQKANEARKQAIDLQKAEYELQRSMHQRTLLQYQEGPDGKGQLVYRNDPNAIKDARDNLEEQQYQKRLTILENELELLEKSRDTLNEQREEIEKHYQELIDETNKYYDEAIKGIEEYKSKWEELAELEEQVIMQVKLESLGLSMEQILSMDEGAFEAFKQNYVGILADIYRENEHVTDALGQNVEGQLSSYMQSLQPFFDQLKQIDLTDTDTALATVTERFQTIQDCLTEIDPVDAINGFESTTRAVNSVVNAINGGGGDVSENVSSDGNLVEAFGEVATAGVEAVEGENGIVPEMQAAKKEIENATEAIIGDGGLAEQIGVISSEPYDIVFNVVVQGADQLKSITGSEATLTGFTKEGSAKFEGTVGNAFANGYPGLNSPEYSALRSEYGQPELTVYPNGTYELTTTPTLSDLPKDTVIFNEEQTKRILKNSVAKNFKGKAFANGTPYLPLQDVMPDKAAIFDKFEANITDNLSKMKNDISEMTSNVREITRTITNNQINNNSGSTVNVGDINVTCPGVTEAEVARNLGAAIRSELNGVVSGMALRANQLAMRR